MSEFNELDLRFKHFGTRDWEEADTLKCTSEQTLKEWIVDWSKFPYYAPGEFDPPLPTPEDIASGPKIGNSSEIFNNVRLISGKYVVKFAASFDLLQEAENLLFLSQHATIRTPKLYAAFLHQGADPLKRFPNPNKPPPTYAYLIMEYIPGSPLSEVWPSLNPTQRSQICKIIGSELRKLRSIPQPLDSPTGRWYYGRLEYQRMLTVGGIFGDPRYPLKKPIDSWEDAVEEIACRGEREACMMYGYGGWNDRATELLERLRPVLKTATVDDYKPVFTHLDLKPRNIMITPRGEGVNGNGKGGNEFDIVFIDWELGAWLPAFMEPWAIPQAAEFDDPKDKKIFSEAVLQAMGPCNRELLQFLWECDLPLGLTFL